MEPKQVAGEAAIPLVEDGMVVGLGTGSTAAFFIAALGRRVRHERMRLVCVPTSTAAEGLATSAGLSLADSVPAEIDLTVDGADEIDPQVDLVKGWGGALLREKVVAVASRRMVVVATEDKLVPRLGRGLVPVEVLPFLWEATARQLRHLEFEPRLRTAASSAYVTDNGNYLLDCAVSESFDPHQMAARIEELPGVMGHGLFLGIAERALVGLDRGGVEERLRPASSS